METNPQRWIEALRGSHERLAQAVGAMGAKEIEGPSYCKDWTVAQVCSHLGSGAEISLNNLESALAGGPPPARESYPPIWDRWNSKSPADQAADCLVSDEAHVSRFESLDEKQLRELRATMLGTEVDAAQLVAFRLGEHAMHTWDVVVSQQPDAKLDQASVNLLIDRAPFLVGRLAKYSGPEKSVRVRTSAPERDLVLNLAEKSSLEESPAGATSHAGELQITSEGLLRLVYGRVDPSHQAEATASGEFSLDDLRGIFGGF